MHDNLFSSPISIITELDDSNIYGNADSCKIVAIRSLVNVFCKNAATDVCDNSK